MTTDEAPLRVAGPADVDPIVATLTSAFFDDPLWGPAFPDRQQRAAQAAQLWRLFASSAQRYPWSLVTPNVEAVALWIPPGGHELTEADEAGLESFLVDLVGTEAAGGILALFEQCEAARPDEPHFYLSLLGTHRDHRGAGIGMALLADTLALIDAEGMPTYLESTNPANDARYVRQGYRPLDQVTLANGHRITTMWRDPA